MVCISVADGIRVAAFHKGPAVRRCGGLVHPNTQSGPFSHGRRGRIFSLSLEGWIADIRNGTRTVPQRAAGRTQCAQKDRLSEHCCRGSARSFSRRTAASSPWIHRKGRIGCPIHPARTWSSACMRVRLPVKNCRQPLHRAVFPGRSVLLFFGCGPGRTGRSYGEGPLLRSWKQRAFSGRIRKLHFAFSDAPLGIWEDFSGLFDSKDDAGETAGITGPSGWKGHRQRRRTSRQTVPEWWGRGRSVRRSQDRGSSF